MPNSTAKILTLIITLFISVNSMGSENYVVENGEIWQVSKNAKTKLTNTGNKVGNILTSPTDEYIAYSKIINYVEDIGDWAKGEKAPLVPRRSVVFLDIKNKRTIKEIIPINEPFLDMHEWISDYSLRIYRSTGLEVFGHYDYNVINNTINKVSLYPDGR